MVHFPGNKAGSRRRTPGPPHPARGLLAAPLLTVPLLAAALLAGCSGPARATYPPPPAAVAAEIRPFLSSLGGAGFSVALSRGSKVEWAGGFGSADLTKRVPATAQTVYQIGSVTKTFTAALVMQLVQEGELGLSDRVGQFVHGLPWGQRVTIAELLDHTSGIVDYATMLGADCPAPSGSGTRCPRLAPAQVVGWLARHALTFEPGTQYQYSNSNYYLLGLVIEQVTGQSYASYLQDHVLRPLALSHTGICPDKMGPPARAVGYLFPGTRPVEVGAYPLASEAFSAGELCSTVGDLVAWIDDLASGRVVSPRTYKEMAAPAQVPGGTAPYGYGLDLSLSPLADQPAVGHGGSTFGFMSLLLHLPRLDLNLAICSNVSSGAVPGTEQAIATEVLQSAGH
jgi:CubicO group peptidase (beta-lactamase class C family)